MASSYSPCMHFFPPFLLGSWIGGLSLSLLLGRSERWTAAHVHITFRSEHNRHTSQINYGQCMTIEKESNQDTSEYWDGSSSSSSSTASSKRIPLFFPMLQSLSCRGCMQCRGLKETLQFWFTPLHLCTGQTRQRLPSVWALDLKRVYNTSSTFFGY